MLEIAEPGPGTGVRQYAEFILRLTQVDEEDEAGQTGQAVRGWFNGTPMDAYPEDESAAHVHMRWHYERLLIQIAKGTLDVRKVADPSWKDLSKRWETG